MKIMVFDTETTGLPNTKFINPYTLNEWPHIVQLSYIIYDTDKDSINKVIQIKDHIIKISDSIKISDISIGLHGITHEVSKSKGLDIEYVLKEFFDYLSSVDKIVGHNVAFDCNMIRVELLRLIYNEESTNKSLYKELLFKLNNSIEKIYCTLKSSVELCNISAINKFGKPYIKFPKLSELHEKLFNSTPSNLHNSLNDVIVTLRCFIKMNYDIDIMYDINHNLNDNINNNINLKQICNSIF